MIKSTIFIIMASSLSLWASGRILNFAETNKVNDLLIIKDKLLTLSGGGINTLNLKTGENHSQYGTIEFPDPDLTASCVDDDGNIWVGSSNGYLATWDPEKLLWRNQTNSYQASGWKITVMIPYGQYLIIGSPRGVSLFDRKEKRAKKNAVSFNSLTITQVNALAINKDRLYVGLEGGVVYLDSISTKLKFYNFFNPAIWKIDSTRLFPVRSFLGINDSLYAYSKLCAIYDGMLVQAVENKLVFGESVLMELPSNISCLKISGPDCWVGTVKDYVYKLTNNDVKHFQMQGSAFGAVNALAAGRNGHVFVIPNGPMNGNEWWRGFEEYNGDTWVIHNRTSSQSMGSMPDDDSKAIVKSREGDIWIGTFGGHCKRYTLSENTWSQYCTYSQRGSQGLSSCGPICPANGWAKSDAVAQDSSGFIWAGCWQNPDGSLICFDPANKPDPNANGTPQAHYRRFFESGNQYNSDNVLFLHVDAFGTILVGNKDDRLLIMNHNGDPISGGVSVLKVIYGTGEIFDGVSTSTGSSYLLTAKMGLSEYDHKNMTLEPMENISSGITAIEIEDDNILWYASSDGLVRYDLVNKERLNTFGKIDGMVSTAVSDLSLDRENGYMWIATDQGVSRLSIGIKSQQPVKEEVTVFPVPFRKNKDKTINFQFVSPRAELAVYSVHGSIVGKPVLVIQNSYQAQFSWTVPARVSPGTYYYVVKDGDSSTRGRLLITP